MRVQINLVPRTLRRILCLLNVEPSSSASIMSGSINLQSFCRPTETPEIEHDVLHSSPEIETRHDLPNGSLPKKTYPRPRCVRITPRKCQKHPANSIKLAIARGLLLVPRCEGTLQSHVKNITFRRHHATGRISKRGYSSSRTSTIAWAWIMAPYATMIVNVELSFRTKV